MKKSLIQKIVKYSVKIELDDFNLAEKNVSSIDIGISWAGGITYKCSVQCPMCNLKFPCIHGKNWQISNLEKHLKRFHANKESASKNSTTDTFDKEPSDFSMI